MDKISYALGMSIAHNMMQSGVNRLQFEDFTAGLKDSMTGAKTALSLEEAGEALNAFFKSLEDEQEAMREQMGKQFKEEGEVFLAANAKKEGVVTLPSGLQYKVIKEGTGKKPSVNDTVRCHYEGTLIDGTKFDSSYDRNEPADFGLKQVIKGWTEGLQYMAEGAVHELYIPFDLAYGANGAGGMIPPYAALVFKVELIKVL